MPAEGVHLTALDDALALERCAPAVRRLCARERDAARLGAVLIDLPYFERLPAQVALYVFGLAPRPSPWGERLHAEGPVGAIEALLLEARPSRDDGMAALALGLASHASLDRDLHPLVNALARAHARPGRTHLQAHMEVEKFHSVILHAERLGGDRMGTPEVVRFLAIEAAPRLEGHRFAAAWSRALATQFGSGPSPGAIASWGRDFDRYARLLGTPLGGRLAPAREQERARPLCFEGPWGRFPDLLDAAVRRSLPILEAALEVYDATGPDIDAARARLRALLPPGTIDGPGLEVDLARPFALEGERVAGAAAR
jgi:hypothetical protein